MRFPVVSDMLERISAGGPVLPNRNRSHEYHETWPNRGQYSEVLLVVSLLGMSAVGLAGIVAQEQAEPPSTGMCTGDQQMSVHEGESIMTAVERARLLIGEQTGHTPTTDQLLTIVGTQNAPDHFTTDTSSRLIIAQGIDTVSIPLNCSSAQQN